MAGYEMQMVYEIDVNQNRVSEQTMLITDEMLQAAVTKAVELGLLPRKAIPEDIATNQELMLEILQSALDAAEQLPAHSALTASTVGAAV